ncbi:MAG: hypothetical protein DKT66_28535 [Candidatus Melainabacteria bacterium]|nr:MAG: hypothetical protein DKT66_28535 [Candidatus Melainabacteria bacterium]
MAEIQKPADQAEQKPDAGIKKPDNLGKDRAVTSEQVAEADAQRTSKFSTFGDMKAYADSNPLLIDMGDGTEVSSKGPQVAWKKEDILKPFEGALHPLREKPNHFFDSEVARRVSQTLPKLSAYSERHEGIGPNLIAAIMNNEQKYYGSIDDAAPDWFVRQTGNLVQPMKDITVGPGQISISNIRHLGEKYPDLFGGTTANDLTKLAVDKSIATALVGAYLDDRIQSLETWAKNTPDRNTMKHDERLLLNNCLPLWKSGQETKALIMSFNPGGGNDHLNNVLNELRKLEKQR